MVKNGLRFFVTPLAPGCRGADDRYDCCCNARVCSAVG